MKRQIRLIPFKEGAFVTRDKNGIVALVSVYKQHECPRNWREYSDKKWGLTFEWTFTDDIKIVQGDGELIF